MAQDAPAAIDMLDIQFKIQDKFMLFNATDELRSNVNLLAISSSRGLLFAGNPSVSELRVLIVKDLVDAKSKEQIPPARKHTLPAVANSLACSSDGNMLAVNYTHQGSGFLNIFSVQSFTTPSVTSLYNIRISPDPHVYALQLLWNPVLPHSLAIVLSNGALAMYALKDGGNYEFFSLDKSQQVKCGCWSPKGKQIVLGFPNGKLQQFKPDLTPAKTIICPPNIHQGPFDTIALHWLSVYQFAAVFLQHGEDSSPSLYIVNAPKGGTPSYVNYFDICYSGNGPRNHQFNIIHVPQWNLILVSSANGVEVGLLGTTETGDVPKWIQYMLLDEARIELPLSESKDETFPMGFVYDTSSTHQLTISERTLQTMPMVHVLSTDGTLICFNFLNLRPDAASVCSPPPPVADTSGQFQPLDSFLDTASTASSVATVKPDMSFAFNANAVTSTPAPPKEKPPSIFSGFGDKQSTVPAATTLPLTQNQPTQPSFSGFGGMSTKPSLGFGFADSNAAAATTTASKPGLGIGVAPFGGVSSFGGLGSTTAPATTAPAAAATATFSGFGGLAAGKAPTFGGFGSKPAETTTLVTPIAPVNNPSVQNQPSQSKPPETNKPLYTVPPTFNPPTTSINAQPQAPATVKKLELNLDDEEQVINQIMAVQINGFNEEMSQLKESTKSLYAQIGDPSAIKIYTKRLNDLQEINEQAKDRDFELDLQNLRQNLSEAYAMVASCRTKLENYKNPDVPRITNGLNPITRRQLSRLQMYLAANETQLQIVQQQVDTQWEQYQDILRRKSKNKMHIPCLEGIYQRITKIQNFLSARRINLDYIKSKLDESGLLVESFKVRPKTDDTQVSDLESLAEKMLSINLEQTVEQNSPRLTVDKLQAIRKAAQSQSVRIIKPQRPDRIGLKSEVILESKLKAERQAAAAAAAKQAAQKATASVTKPISAKPVQVKSKVETQPQPQQPTKPAPVFTTTNNQSGSLFGSSTIGKPTEATSPGFGSFGSGISTGTAFNFAQGKTPSNAPTLSFGNTTATVKPITATDNKPTTPTTKTATTSTESLFAGFGSGLTITKTSAPVKDKTPPKSAEAEINKPFSFSTSTSNSNNPATSSGLSFSGFNTVLGSVSSASTTNAPATTFSFSNLSSESGTALSIFGKSSSMTTTTTTTASIFAAPAVSSTSSFAPPMKAPEASQATSSTTAAPTLNTAAAVVSSSNTAGSFTFGTATVSTPATTAPTRANSQATLFTVSNSVTTSATTTDSTDRTLSSLTICSPTNRDGAGDFQAPNTQPGSTHSGLRVGSFSFTNEAGGDAAHGFFANATNTGSNLFGGTTTTRTTTTTTTSATAVTPVATSIAASTPTSPTTTAAAMPATTKSGQTVTAANTASIPTTTTTASSASTSTSPFGGTSSFSFSSAFGALSTGTSTAASTAPTATLASNVAATSIFSTPTTTVASITSPFQATNVTSSSSVFGGGAVSGSIFAQAAATSPFGTPSSTAAVATPFGGSTTMAQPIATSPFAVSSATTTTTAVPAQPVGGSSIFSGIPKPDQSVFGSGTVATSAAPPSGLFAAAAASNPSPFSSPQSGATSGGNLFATAAAATTSPKSNLFGGATVGTAAPAGGSIFGGGSAGATPTSPFGAASIFGGATKPAGDASVTNIFGGGAASTTATTQATGSSVFSGFGQSAMSGGSIFGSTAAATVTPSSAASIFGGGTPNAGTSGGSIFGGGSAPTAAPAFGSGFGSFSSQPSPAATVFGGFAQGGASVAQTGFGSPPQQQQQPQNANAFPKPAFGGGYFGSPTPAPAFGASPTFGGAATFGSPKGFGTFSATTNTTSPTGFGAPTQKNTLFETLGSTDTGLSFGNLAQTGTGNAQKPAFGGSSFMNYRA